MPVSAETLRLLMAAGLKDAALLEVVDSIEADNKAKPRSSGGPDHIVRNGKWNEGEWQRRRRAVFERDGYVCVYCGRDVSDAPQCDHVHPVQHGGSSEMDNLATACKQCNSSKSGKLLSEWERPEWE